MNNPMQILKTMVNSKNPQDLVINMISKNSNPMFSNLIGMAKKGDTKSVENFAKNLCQQKGINYNEAFPEFMKQLKG